MGVSKCWVLPKEIVFDKDLFWGVYPAGTFVFVFVYRWLVGNEGIQFLNKIVPGSLLTPRKFGYIHIYIYLSLSLSLSLSRSLALALPFYCCSSNTDFQEVPKPGHVLESYAFEASRGIKVGR